MLSGNLIPELFIFPSEEQTLHENSPYFGLAHRPGALRS